MDKENGQPARTAADEHKELKARYQEDEYFEESLTYIHKVRLNTVRELLNLLDTRLIQYPLLCDDLVIHYVVSGEFHNYRLVNALEVLKLADEVRGL